jgi:enoyl-CoA hydratase
VPADDAPYEVISVEQDGHVATLFLDRPEKRNAMGAALFRELPEAFCALGRDETVRVVVVAAKGPHFCVGLDLHSLNDLADGSQSGTSASPASVASRTRGEVVRLQEAISSVAACPKPVVAAVHGYCIGGGVDLISACDIRLASANAVFSVRETKMAIVADLGSLQRLPLTVPMGHVAELAFTGKDISAERAERIGLVNSLFEDQQGVLDGASEMARQIAANSPLAVQGTKAVLQRMHRQLVADGLDYVATWNAGHLRSDDLAEAVLSFMEKRPPSFKGR